MLLPLPASQVAASSSWASARARVRKAALFFLSLAALLTGGEPVRAQVLDSFDPNADWPVWAFAVQSDGNIVICGDFGFLSPNGGAAVERRYIARVKPDGTLDLAFNPSPNGSIRAIALQADGKILVAGGFTTIGTQQRRRLARLDPATGLADPFNPDPDNNVWAIAVQADGRIVVGGRFTNIGGQERHNIARLDPATGLADSFDPNANSFVYQLLVQPDGRILAGGGYDYIGGENRIALAQLDATTGLADSFNPNTSGGILSLAIQPDGKILAGGLFNSIGGQQRRNIARLDPTTGLADSFKPDAMDRVYALAVQPDGKVLAGGYFNGAGSIGGQTRNRIARLDATTGLADSFDPDADNHVMSIVQQPDGKILVGGYFTAIGGQSRNRVARFLAPTPAPTPSPPPGATPTPTPTATPAPAAQAINLSTRMFVQTGTRVGIGGFIITGSAPKHVILRAIGPSLTEFGANALADPVLELHGPGGFVTTTNDNWGDDPVQRALIEASGLAPTNDLESAIDATLAPGPYTAIVSGRNDTSGFGLVEIYDLNQSVDAKLANISTRALVAGGTDSVFAGFILGNGGAPDRVVVRGLGPSLTELGLPQSDVLFNPRWSCATQMEHSSPRITTGRMIRLKRRNSLRPVSRRQILWSLAWR